MLVPRHTIALFVFALIVIEKGLCQLTPKMHDRSFWENRPSLVEVQNQIARGDDPTSKNEYDFDALSWALIEQADESILEFLLSLKGNGVDKLTHDERTYLFWAAYRNNLSFMKTLEIHGARFDVVDEHGYSLLNFSAVTGQTNLEL